MTRVAFMEPLLTRRPMVTRTVRPTPRHRGPASRENYSRRITRQTEVEPGPTGAPPRSRLAAVAPYLLALSLAARFAVTYLVPERHQLHRPARLRRRRGDHGPRRSVRLRLPPGDAAATAAVHLSALRRAGVLPAAPPAVLARRPRLAARHRGGALRVGRAGAAVAGPSRRATGDGVDRAGSLVRARPPPLRARPDRGAADGRGAARGQYPALVGGRRAGGAGCGAEADPRGRRPILRGRPPVAGRRLARRWCSARRSPCRSPSAARRPASTSPICSATPTASASSTPR